MCCSTLVEYGLKSGQLGSLPGPRTGIDGMLPEVMVLGRCRNLQEPDLVRRDPPSSSAAGSTWGATCWLR